MPRSDVPLLSKSRFAAGLQCPGRLYRMCYQPELATPPDAARQALFDAGTQVGMLARQLRPDGVLVDDPAFQHEQAVAKTRDLIASNAAPAVYEAAFTAGDVRIRADILSLSDGGAWDLIEVKSSTSVKDEHLPDAAIQFVTLGEAGIQIEHVAVAHLNSDYVYDGGEYVLNRLFTVEDVTRTLGTHTAAVPEQLASLRATLRLDEAPKFELESYCSRPYPCEFYEHCSSSEPEWTIEELPRIDDRRRRELREIGARSIGDIPRTFKLTPTQERVRNAVASGRAYVAPTLMQELARIVAPAHFVDFETMNPALPIHAGTRPYEVQPFQWSDHVVSRDGSVEHFAFLADGREDPRREFAETLIDRLSDARTIVVYSAFEQTRLRQLQSAFPDLNAPLQDLLDRPWVDLLKVIRENYYHPGFHGSYSIKSVLPALVPDFGYADLEIRGGDVASSSYLLSIDSLTSPERRREIRANLLAYCARDTEAMLRIVEALRAK